MLDSEAPHLLEPGLRGPAFLRAVMAAAEFYLWPAIGQKECMHTTIDIPDSLYRKLKSRAGNEGRSVRELVLGALRKDARDVNLGRISWPGAAPKRPGTLDLDNAKIFEIIPFP